MKNKTKQSKGKLPKAKRNKPKRLIRIRQSLMLLAALLFLLTLFSGYMAFFANSSDQKSESQIPDIAEHSTSNRYDAKHIAVSGAPTPGQDSQISVFPIDALTNSNLKNTPNEGEAGSPDPNANPDPTTSSDHPSGSTGTVTPDSTSPASTEDTGETLETTEVEETEEAISTIPTLDDFIEDVPTPSGFDWNTFPWDIIFFACLTLLALDLLAVLLLDRKILSMRKKNPQFEMDPIPHTLVNGVFVTQPLEPVQAAPSLTIGSLHQPGRRQYQQDSLGHGLVLDGRGILAVLADGMGGLQDGDKVSQKIIVRSLELGATLQSNQVGGALYRMLNQVNEDVNRMLTPSGLYKCGSTMVAVLVQDMTFQWISVGDSRIYLYREGYVNRLNRDHDLFQDWMPEILNGNRVMEDCLADPDGRKLTSFIGMGRLKYVDGSISAIDILPGDRILLMSDGVYGEVPEEEMAAILKQFPDVNQAAAALDRRVRANQNPHQDNYTALILGF